jgi:hypothetical protein
MARSSRKTRRLQSRKYWHHYHLQYTLANGPRYGDEKGACEMLFSYGFIEDSMDSAKVMFIDLTIPEDDPLRMAKLSVSTTAPGFRLFDRGDGTGWESDFVWLIVVNEEDGLGINVLQTIDGKYEMKSRWKEEELVDTAQLRELLVKEELWDVYQLRAVAILQARVEVQMRMLYAVGTPERDDHIRQTPWKLARKLRELELALLEKLYGDLEDQVRFSPGKEDSPPMCQVLACSRGASLAQHMRLPLTLYFCRSLCSCSHRW